MRGLAAGTAIALACAGEPAAAASAADTRPPLRDEDYWAFADAIMPALDERWNADAGAYVSSFQGASSRTNANMLIIHSLAAARGHVGPTRQDARAHSLIAHMTRRPMTLVRRYVPGSGRSVCWATELITSEPDHISVDSQVAEALDYAWTARAALGLSPASAAAIAAVVDRCADHWAWRFPSLLSNQINWNAQLYAHAARITGHGDLLRHDYRRHLLRFASGSTRRLRGAATTNLGPGYGFHYSPAQPRSARLNFDAVEYANIVLTALQYHRQARLAGMARLPRRATRLFRAWVIRLLAGSWTHGGYLNWDTGNGTARWHSGQYWAFAQQALLTMANARHFWSHPRTGRWAKAIFDRGLLLYARWAHEGAGPRAPGLLFGVRSQHRDRDLYASRMAANAVRAIHLGVGAKRAEDPPPLYAFDGETGRLAVTTPRYSTAVVSRNRGAFDYGGIDLARLYGPGQRVAANIGGVPPSAFGAVVSDRGGHTILASQRIDGNTTSLRLTRSPRGRITRPPSYPARPLAGRFEQLEARGHTRRGRFRIATTYRFHPRHIDARWRIACDAGCRRHSAVLHFPTWGDGAAIDVIDHGHGRVQLAGPDPRHDTSGMPLAGVARVRLGRGSEGGYDVAPLSRPHGATLNAVRTYPQRYNPDPGPILAIVLPPAAHRRPTGMAVRISLTGCDPAPCSGPE